MIGYLLTRLEQAGLLNKLNILVVSDHGMATMNKTNIVKDYVSTSLLDYNRTIYGIVSHVTPKKAEDVMISSL